MAEFPSPLFRLLAKQINYYFIITWTVLMERSSCLFKRQRSLDKQRICNTDFEFFNSIHLKIHLLCQLLNNAFMDWIFQRAKLCVPKKHSHIFIEHFLLWWYFLLFGFFVCAKTQLGEQLIKSVKPPNIIFLSQPTLIIF